MEKYYSSVLSSSGLLCSFKLLCEKHPESKFYIINDGTDAEREIFFDELCKCFKGFNITVFSPFYCDAVNGIYLKSFDTYVLSDSVYSRVCPVSPYSLETEIRLSGRIKISADEKKQLARFYSAERVNYKKAVSFLALSGVCAENRNSLLSDYIIDDRLINALRRVMKKIPLKLQKGKPTVRLLCAAAPLGIHTLWDTVFGGYETVIELEDSYAFSSAIIAGLIRDKLISENEEFIFVPDLFHRTIPHMLLLPQSGTALVRTDENHPLPFSSTHRINTEKFLSVPKHVKAKCGLLTEAANNYIENAVACIYEGADLRRKANNLLLPFGNAENAKEKAHELYERIVK